MSDHNCLHEMYVQSMPSLGVLEGIIPQLQNSQCINSSYKPQAQSCSILKLSPCLFQFPQAFLASSLLWVLLAVRELLADRQPACPQLL